MGEQECWCGVPRDNLQELRLCPLTTLFLPPWPSSEEAVSPREALSCTVLTPGTPGTAFPLPPGTVAEGPLWPVPPPGFWVPASKTANLY